MRSKRVLVTGGAGFIGKTLSNYLSNKKFSVIVLDDLSSGNTNGLNKNIKFRRVDILNSRKLGKEFAEFKPDTVFHLAAKSSRNPNDEKVLDNIEGTLNVITNCIRSGTRKVIFSSSASVYGEASRFPIRENSVIKPVNNYGMTKAVSELIIKTMLDYAKISYTILRLSNVYGPGQRSDSEGGVASIFWKAAKSGKKAVIYGDGKQTRDFIYVDDVVEALYKSMFAKTSFIANVSASRENSINNLLKIIESISLRKINIDYKPKLTGEIKRSVLSNSEAKKHLGWKPTTSLSEGIGHFV